MIEQENPFGFDPQADVVREERTQWLGPIVAVSGGFDPAHEGHVALFKAAAKYGQVHVLLNSDEWLIRKKGSPLLPWKTRKELLINLSAIHRVHTVDDRDDTVCNGLKELRKAYPNTKIFFANGGDRKEGNTPEIPVCEAHEIEILWNIGGGKVNSSSALLSEYEHKHGIKHLVSRDWGTYEIIAQGKSYLTKILSIFPRRNISYQRHTHRTEEWLVLEGKGLFVRGHSKFDMFPKNRVRIPPLTWHWVKNTSDLEPLCILETWFGDILEESDIEREDFHETPVPE